MSDQQLKDVLQGREVNRDELAEKSVEELLNEGVINQNERSEFEDRAYLQHTSASKKPNSVSSVQKLMQKLLFAKTMLVGALQWLSQTISLDNVKEKLDTNTPSNVVYYKITTKPADDSDEGDVKLLLETEAGEKEITLDSDSRKFATLLEYYKVDSADELDGKHLIRCLNPHSDLDLDYVVLPHNTSILGTLRYKLYGYLSKVRGKLLYAESAFKLGIGIWCIAGGGVMLTKLLNYPSIQSSRGSGLESEAIMLVLLAAGCLLYGLMLFIFEAIRHVVVRPKKYVSLASSVESE